MLNKFKRNKHEVSIISSSMTVTGELVTGGDVVVYGNIIASKGKAISTTGNVDIRDKAEVRGDILANSVILKGTLIGNIKAIGSVTLLKGSRVLGDIECKSIRVSDGVDYNGSVKVVKDEEELKDKSKLNTKVVTMQG